MADFVIYYTSLSEYPALRMLRTAHRHCFERFQQLSQNAITPAKIIKDCGEAACYLHGGTRHVQPYRPAVTARPMR